MRRLLDGLPVEVTSVGTQNLGPAPPLQEAISIARRFGIDISSHRARPLSGAGLDRADLVIGFEREHVSLAVVEGGARHERTFLGTELVVLLGRVAAPDSLDPVARARYLISEAHRLRPRPGVAMGSLVRDPLAGPPGAYERVAKRLRELSESLAEGLFDPGRR